MPVDKLDGAVLRKRDIPYDLIPRAEIDALKTGEAMAIYILMATRPPNWVFNKEWIMSRTGFGYDRYRKGMKELEGLGLVTQGKVRNPDGTIKGQEIWFTPLNDGKSISDDLSTGTPENREPGKSRTWEIPAHKDTENKLKIQRGGFALPDGVDREVWQEWDEYRREYKKKGWTAVGMKKAATMLSRLTPQQQRQVVDYSIQGGYTGLFTDRIKPEEERKGPANPHDPHGHAGGGRWV